MRQFTLRSKLTAVALGVMFAIAALVGSAWAQEPPPHRFYGTDGTPGDMIGAVSADGAALGSTTVGADGSWHLDVPQDEAGTAHLTLNGHIAVGMVTARGADQTEVAMLVVAPHTFHGSDGTAGDMVGVVGADGAALGSATVAEDGSWHVEVAQADADGVGFTLNGWVAEGMLTVQSPIQTEVSMLALSPHTFHGSDGTPGDMIGVVDGHGHELGSATVAEDGSWHVEVAQDAADSASLTLNGRPAEGVLTEHGPIQTEVSMIVLKPHTFHGSDGTPGDVVGVVDGHGHELGSATVAEDGSWHVEVAQDDADGVGFTLNGWVAEGMVTAHGAIMTEVAMLVLTPHTFHGSDARPGATIGVVDPDGEELGSAEVAEDGSWHIEVAQDAAAEAGFTLNGSIAEGVLTVHSAVQTEVSMLAIAWHLFPGTGTGGLADNGGVSAGLLGLLAALGVLTVAGLGLRRVRNRA